MFKIEFYEEDGCSKLWDFLEELRIKSHHNKNARIQFNQISLYIQLLRENGTRLPENITKHLEDGIWELRPGYNRILYYCEDDEFILLHYFRKKTNKTPKREIEKAKNEIHRYLNRKGSNEL